MLTAFQVERVAYVGDGEIVCRACAVAEYEAIEAGDGQDSTPLDDMSWAEDDQAIEVVLGYAPVSRFEMDEYDASASADGLGDGHEECACTLGVNCDECGGEIVEAFYDDYEHQA